MVLTEAFPLPSAMAVLRLITESYLRPSLGSRHSRTAIGVWYATTNERTRRDMLRAAVKAVDAPKPQAHTEILWLLGELEGLAGKRNTAIHSPLVLVTNMDAGQIRQPESMTKALSLISAKRDGLRI